MQSPRAEWVLWGIHAGILDALRDRGEPDGDTLTEVIREAFHVDHPLGRAALAAAITTGGVLLYRHIAKPEMRGA